MRKRILALWFVLPFAACAQLDISSPFTVAAIYRVQTPGAWSPTTPTNGILEYLRAADLSGSDGDSITTWTANQGKNAANSGGTTRPTLRTGGPNSNKYLEFDGTTDYLQTAAWDAAPSLPVTAMYVFQCRSVGNSVYLFEGIASGNRFGILENSGDFRLYAGSAIESFKSPSTTGWHNLLIEWNGASTKWSLDNSAYATIASTPGSQSPTGITLGAAFNISAFSPVDILEVAVWNAPLGATDFQAATNYSNGLIR